MQSKNALKVNQQISDALPLKAAHRVSPGFNYEAHVE